jgi:uncharacterized protein YjbI with pentapeptide repeats
MPFKRQTFGQSRIVELAADEQYSRCSFEGLAVKHADLSNCVFESCKFKGADLTNTKFNGSTFDNCDLSNVKLAGNNLFAARFEQCKCLGLLWGESIVATGAKLIRCTLDYGRFRGASLEGLHFEECSLIEADLSLCNLKKTVFQKCNLDAVDWSGAGFEQTDLRGSQLQGLNLCRVNCAGIILASAQLEAVARALGIAVLP